jgi:hypothetical protein
MTRIEAEQWRIRVTQMQIQLYRTSGQARFERLWLMPHAATFSPRAIWSRAQACNGYHGPLVADISMVFMLEPAAVMQHVQDGFWSYLSGDIASGDPTKITVEMDGA